MTRIKAPALQSRAEFERVIDDIAQSTVALRKLEASRDERIQTIRAEWEPYCGKHTERIASLIVLAEKYAEEHRDQLFPGKVKSSETPLALFGFRLGNPTLRLLNKKCSWEACVNLLKALKLSALVRTVEEPDRDAIKAAKLPDETMKQLGIKITQDDTFFVEPKDKATEVAA